MSSPATAPPRGLRFPSFLSFRNIGAVYVWIVIVIVFTFWASETFLTWDTAKQVLNNNSITALIALSIVVPLCARVFDLSVAYTASLAGVTSTYMIVHGVPTGLAVLIAIGAALAVGLVNAIVVVLMGVDSFIATLATGSLIQSFITMVTDDISITDVKLAGPFAKIAQTEFLGFILPVWYALAAAILIWYLLEHTVTGRRIYATGFNPDAARLSGVRTAHLQFGSLIFSSLLAGFAGVVLSSNIGSGSPTAGTPYLLSAFAASFLGATQLRGGRFNAWGTVIAVILLGTGITGLGLAGAPTWAPNMFTGVVLIAALAITGSRRIGLLDRRRARRQAAAADHSPDVGST